MYFEDSEVKVLLGYPIIVDGEIERPNVLFDSNTYIFYEISYD